ncbi:MAG TPA: adenylate/guanylate cyclase domain-containing protein, partial [Micromonosporaceae bacterium]
MSVRIHLPRGMVTFLFTDIEGSTRLAQMLGDGYRSVLTRHRRLLRRILTAHGGTPLFSEGDSLFVAFTDPGAALTACVEAQRALAGYDWPHPQARPRVRMGLHTGWAQPRAGEYASPEVHRAARVCAAAHGGQVLCTGATAEHAVDLPGEAALLDLGLHRLRGFDRRERLYQLVAPGLDRHFPRPRTPDAVPHNLPVPVTSLVGRVVERADLTALVEQCRLVDVVGPPGAGKSRLALEIAAGQVDAYRDGVWYVDLAALAGATDAPVAGGTGTPLAGGRSALPAGGTADELVAGSVAAGLGLRPEPGRPVLDTLAEYVAPRRVLLVLDTCDAQPVATARVATRLLTAGPAVRVLATGREPLKVPGEVVYRVAPLSLTGCPGGGPSEAGTLLRQRAAAARGGRR